MPTDPQQPHAMDHPLWYSLIGDHARFSAGTGNVRRYLPSASTLAALAPDATGRAWFELHDLLEPGDFVALFFFDPAPPIPGDCGLRVVYEGEYDQMLCTATLPDPAQGAADRPTFVELGDDDVAEMLTLVDLTQPGPFAPRTIELGRYIGIRDPANGGRLVAMAGERGRFTGHREISAVCTHPDHRGRGHADVLVRELVGSSLKSGESTFLHVRSDNDTARRAYERIGFKIRRPMRVVAVQRIREGIEPAGPANSH